MASACSARANKAGAPHAAGVAAMHAGQACALCGCGARMGERPCGLLQSVRLRGSLGDFMSQIIQVHPVNPQPRAIKQAVDVLARGEVLAVPTDSGYALVCHIDDKAASDRLRQLRGVDAKHHLTLLCRDLSELSSYARVDNRQYRLLKQGTPGAFTFILEATKEVPRRLSHPSRKTIGLRVPQHAVLQSLLEAHGQPVLGTTLILPGDDAPLYEASEIDAALHKQLAAIVDAGPCPHMPTTVVDLTEMGSGGDAVLLRRGAGDPTVLGL